MKKITKEAKELGVSESEYMRACVRGTLMDNPKFRNSIAELTYEIHKIGVNVNQISYHHNAGLMTVKEKDLLLEIMKDIRKGVLKVVAYGNNNSGHITDK